VPWFLRPDSPDYLQWCAPLARVGRPKTPGLADCGPRFFSPPTGGPAWRVFTQSVLPLLSLGTPVWSSDHSRTF